MPIQQDELKKLIDYFLENNELREYGIPHSYDRKESSCSYMGLLLKTGLNSDAVGSYLAFRDIENNQLRDSKYPCVQILNNDYLKIGIHIGVNKMDNEELIARDDMDNIINTINTVINRFFCNSVKSTER